MKKEHPEIPWRDIAGMRDKAIHSYFGINPQRIWQVIKEDLPVLRPVIEKTFKKLKR